MSNKQPTYEELKSELDVIVSDLQHSDIDVDETLQKYQRGLELVKQLQFQLKDAENTIAKLQATFAEEK